jgi:hypothetical protein
MASAPLVSTYKHLDVEETLDIYFTRPLGYLLALVGRRAGLSPNAVTIIGMAVGALGGHLLFYDSIQLNIIGILLFILSGILDSSDGMLARMTGQYSRLGRILDGFADNVKFISVYLHLCIGYIVHGGSGWIFTLAVAAGISHSMQAAAADYIRSAYLHFADDNSKDWDDPASIAKQCSQLDWKKDFFEKLLLRLYQNHAHEQRFFFNRFNKLLKNTVSMKPTEDQYEGFTRKFRKLNRPMLKYCNILTTNTRSIVLYISVLTGMPLLFFAFELTILNALLFYVVRRQERIALSLSTISTSSENRKGYYEEAA